MNNKILFYLKHAFVIVVDVALIAKSIYKLLGYGTPIDAFWKFIYGGGLILFSIALPLYVYKVFLKK